MRGILQMLFPSLIWNFSSEEKVIYITFDDGPHPELTPFILQELDKHKAKATFFLLGKEVDLYPSLLNDILQKNHSVGNHTYSHLNGWKTKNREYFSDTDKCHAILSSKLFRPPFGRIKPSQIWRLRKTFKIIMWDVLSWDFHKAISPKKCFKIIKKKTKNGSIIVFHENDKAISNVKYCLPKILDYYAKEGYKFRAITD
ncbi:MAG: polysaccharide deacetylase family protein [Flavobacteriales bacterium]|nr:polysaccharide deacetylase family protein [Flavobacteriales bacterium]MBL6873511.1 polysaccharide deacetylase family protein [Flavobacteriales bacterium]